MIPAQHASFCNTCWSCIQGTAEIYGEPQVKLPNDTPAVLYRHHKLSSSYVAAVNEQCRICTALWEHFSPVARSVLPHISDEWCEGLGDDVPFMLCSIANMGNIKAGHSASDEGVYIFVLMFPNQVKDVIRENGGLEATHHEQANAVFLFHQSDSTSLHRLDSSTILLIWTSARGQQVRIAGIKEYLFGRGVGDGVSVACNLSK